MPLLSNLPLTPFPHPSICVCVSTRLSDAAKWEFEEVPTAPDSFYLKSLLNNKWCVSPPPLSSFKTCL